MALYYRVVACGEPKGPWRVTKRQAEADAIQTGWGERDEDGRTYLDALASIEWCHEDALRLRA